MLQAFLARTYHSRSFGGLLVCQVQVRSSATSARQLPCIGYNRHSKHVNGLSLHSYCESAAARSCVLSAASLACLCMHKKELASLEIIHSIGIRHWFRCLGSSVNEPHAATCLLVKSVLAIYTAIKAGRPQGKSKAPRVPLHCTFCDMKAPDSAKST